LLAGCLVNSIFMGRGAPGEHESCLVNSIFMGRGAPGEHESFVANFHLR